MMSGLLSGKFDLERVAHDDWRRKDRVFQEPHLSEALALVETRRPIAPKYGKSIGQVAIAWVNMSPAVTSSIARARTVSQVEENVKADFELDRDDLYRIESALKETMGKDR